MSVKYVTIGGIKFTNCNRGPDINVKLFSAPYNSQSANWGPYAGFNCNSLFPFSTARSQHSKLFSYYDKPNGSFGPITDLWGVAFSPAQYTTFTFGSPLSAPLGNSIKALPIWWGDRIHSINPLYKFYVAGMSGLQTGFACESFAAPFGVGPAISMPKITWPFSAGAPCNVGNFCWEFPLVGVGSDVDTPYAIITMLDISTAGFGFLPGLCITGVGGASNVITTPDVRPPLELCQPWFDNINISQSFASTPDFYNLINYIHVHSTLGSFCMVLKGGGSYFDIIAPIFDDAKIRTVYNDGISNLSNLNLNDGPSSRIHSSTHGLFLCRASSVIDEYGLNANILINREMTQYSVVNFIPSDATIKSDLSNKSTDFHLGPDGIFYAWGPSNKIYTSWGVDIPWNNSLVPLGQLKPFVFPCPGECNPLNDNIPQM